MCFPVTTYGLTGREIHIAKITGAKSVCIFTGNATLTAQCIHLSSTTRLGRFCHHRVEPQQHTRKNKPRLLIVPNGGRNGRDVLRMVNV